MVSETTRNILKKARSGVLNVYDEWGGGATRVFAVILCCISPHHHHHHHHPNPLVVMVDAVAMFSLSICCRNLLYFLLRLNVTSST